MTKTKGWNGYKVTDHRKALCQLLFDFSETAKKGKADDVLYLQAENQRLIDNNREYLAEMGKLVADLKAENEKLQNIIETFDGGNEFVQHQRNRQLMAQVTELSTELAKLRASRDNSLSLKETLAKEQKEGSCLMRMCIAAYTPEFIQERLKQAVSSEGLCPKGKEV